MNRYEYMFLLTLLPVVQLYHLLPANKLPPQSSEVEGTIKMEAKRFLVPYHVLVVFKNLYCSGCLVGSRTVLTVASCVMLRGKSPVVVKVGSQTITSSGQILGVIEIKIHEYYGLNSNMDNDIAILFLESHVIFSIYVKKIVLVEPETALRDKTAVVVSGWGHKSNKLKHRGKLLWSRMHVVNSKICSTAYPFDSSLSNYCVKYQPENNLSDNGGPAVYNSLLVGLLIFGATNSQHPNIALMTNISYFYRWISINTQKLLTKYCVVTKVEREASQENYCRRN